MRQAGPEAVSRIQGLVQTGLNEMNTRRRKLLDVEKEYKYFRETNGLENRTAKMTTPTGTFIRILLILIMVVSETYLMELT